MTIRKLLLRIPVLGPRIERRWMPDPIERDAHRDLVLERLHEPIAPPIPAPMEAEEPLPARVTEGAPEDRP